MYLLNSRFLSFLIVYRKIEQKTNFWKVFSNKMKISYQLLTVIYHVVSVLHI
jgi:hypothetical protein